MVNDMRKKVVEVKNLSFGYGDKLVLDNVDLYVKEGDFMGIVGPNGSAKSTLLKLTLGILRPNAGEVRLFDTPIAQFKDWYKIGYVSQRVRDFNLSFPATVEEIIAANLHHSMGAFKFLTKKHKEKIDQVLEIVGMQDYKKRLIGQMSGGQQQRIFIARVLASDPRILFLDEPTVGVDAKSQQQFYELLGRLNKELNMTLVMVSHDIGVITKQANRIACLGNQKIFIDRTEDFDQENYIRSVYGEYAELLHHEH